MSTRLATEPTDGPLETVTLGLGLLIAQNFIVTNQFFDEKEIRSYLLQRRQFHGDFVVACTSLADSFEQGHFGQAVKPAATALRAISHFGPRQEQQALRHFSRAMRGLRRLTHRDVEDPRIFKLLHIAKQLEGIGSEGFDYYSHKSSIENFLTMLIKVPSVPAKIRTLLRKVIKMPLPNAGVMDTANAGAWFEMPDDTKESLRVAVTELEAEQEQIFQKITDPDARSEAYKTVNRKLQRIQNVAGVNVGLIKQEDAVPIETLLKQEAKLTVDGPTEFLRLQLEQRVRETARYQYNRKEGEPLPREVSKLITQLRKAKTFSTASRILTDANQRKILRMHDEDLTSVIKRAGKNRAIREGKPLTPLHYTPKTADEFQAEHNTGRVIFDPEFTEDERKELLGRVSRAVSDLEIVYGKGFCGAHKSKLEFKFNKGNQGTASAHYFVNDDKSKWQPRVTFGPEYEGLLAHELSHYLEDLLTYKMEEERESQLTPADERRKYPNYGGNIFGNTGVPLDRFSENGVLSRGRELIGKSAPELVEFVDAVLKTEDYRRWEDKLGSAYDTALPRALSNLAGMDYYDIPKGHPYYGLVDSAKYRSDLPPEVNEEVKKVFSALTGGDTRKLSYYNSSTEVWARMCEQYVYNKLIEAGISNPWLTQLTYDIDDNDVFMDEKTFDETLRPIMDRLFARLKGRRILARVLERYLTATADRHPMSYSYGCRQASPVAMSADEFVASVQSGVNITGRHLALKVSADGARNRVYITLVNLEARVQHGRADALANRLSLVVTGFDPRRSDLPAPGKVTLEPHETGSGYSVRGLTAAPATVAAVVVKHVNAMARLEPKLEDTPTAEDLAERQVALRQLSPAQRKVLLLAFDDSALRIHAADFGHSMSRQRAFYNTCDTLVRKRLMTKVMRNGYTETGVYELTDAGVGISRQLIA